MIVNVFSTRSVFYKGLYKYVRQNKKVIIGKYKVKSQTLLATFRLGLVKINKHSFIFLVIAL